MISRRHVLAAAMTGASASVPFLMSRAEAAAFLDGSPTIPAHEAAPELFRPWSYTYPEIVGAGPVAFAEDVAGGLESYGLFAEDTPAEMAHYLQALVAVEDASQGLLITRPDNALGDLDDAARDMWVASWVQGLRLGAALEHARLALTSTLRICPACLGYGHARDEAPGERTVCEECAGAGTLSAVFG